MGRLGWLSVSGSAWAVMMFLLFQREILPYFEYQTAPTYQTIFRDLRVPVVERRGIHFSETRIGSAEQLSEPLPGGGVRMRSRLLMSMKPFGVTLLDDRAYMTSDFRLDSAYQLADFRLAGRLQSIPVSARGDRQGDKLRVSYNFMILKGDLLVDFPRDATLSDTFLPYQGGGRLDHGKKWKIRMFDLGNVMSIGKDKQVELTELYATVVGREKPPTRPGLKDAWQVEVRRQPTEEFWTYLLWVDEDGTVLEQHMKINKLICKIVLEEKTSVEPSEAADFKWAVEPPK